MLVGCFGVYDKAIHYSGDMKLRKVFNLWQPGSKVKGRRGFEVSTHPFRTDTSRHRKTQIPSTEPHFVKSPPLPSNIISWFLFINMLILWRRKTKQNKTAMWLCPRCLTFLRLTYGFQRGNVRRTPGNCGYNYEVSTLNSCDT